MEMQEKMTKRRMVNTKRTLKMNRDVTRTGMVSSEVCGRCIETSKTGKLAHVSDVTNPRELIR